jgi:hypothetical protein
MNTLKYLIFFLLLYILNGCGNSTNTNHPPVAYDKNISVTPGNPVNVPFQADDIDGDNLSYTITKLPEHGTFDPNTITYTMKENYSGTDTIVFYVEDDKDVSNSATIKFISTHDNSPSIDLIGNATINIKLGTNYTDPGSTAYDIEDGNLTDSIEVSGNVNTDEFGTYTLTYTVTDSASNSASIKRIVNVVPDVDHSQNSVMIVDPTKNKIVVTYLDENSSYDNEVLTVNIHDNTPALSTKPKMVKLFDNYWALSLKGNGIQNSFHIVGYDEIHKYNWKDNDKYQNKYNLSWDAKFDGDFIVYVVLDFISNGSNIQKDIVYTPSPNGYEDYTDNGSIHFYIGSDKKDNHWFHFQRNILDDLHTKYPNATIKDINGIAIRGTAMVASLKLSK